MQRFLLLYLLLFSCTDSYQEYRTDPMPQSMNTVYLKDSLRYLSLTDAQHDIIESTFTDHAVADPIILFYPKEGIKVLMIKDNRHMTQTINIIALQNGLDIYKAHKYNLIKSELFTFPINAYYYKIYDKIRKDLIHNLDKTKSVRINTLGSASTYGILLAIELSVLEIPLESIVSFGASRFTSQEYHDQLKHNFGNRMIALVHDNDISNKIYMGRQYAAMIPDEYLICEKTQCESITYTQEDYSLYLLNKHISNFPHSYAEMYHDSILYMEGTK